MYIIVSAAHPRHCQPACILPVSKLPGTWWEKLRAITEPPLRGVSSLRAQQPGFSLHGDSTLTSGMLLTPFNVHFQRQNVAFLIWNCSAMGWITPRGRALVTERQCWARTSFFSPECEEVGADVTFDLEVDNKDRVIWYSRGREKERNSDLLWGMAKNDPS